MVLRTTDPLFGLSTGQAAHELGVSQDWVRRLCNAGRLPSVTVGYGFRLIPREAVEQYKREHEQREGRA